MNLNNYNNLNNLSSVDGRYYKYTTILRSYLSEYAYFKYRLKVEVLYLLELLQTLEIHLENTEKEKIKSILVDFKFEECIKIKNIEETINHDVKAIEYYICDKLKYNGLDKLISYVHFALTSQDINNTAIPLMLKDTICFVYTPLLINIISKMDDKVTQWKNCVIITKTHGQPAVPSTFGKEFKIFSYRLQKQLSILNNIKFYGKFSGASGNFNAHVIAFPNINWKHFSTQFLNNTLKLEFNEYNTQIDNYENISVLFDCIKRINCILLDFCQDMWLYISNEYLKLKITEKEVGSSTMPHKVNPIQFENAEGNLYFTNAMLEVLSRKLPISRLQRDLTDSTLIRNVGNIFGHILIAYQNILKGLKKIDINIIKIEEDKTKYIIVIMEAIQTILRKHCIPNAYEKCKEFSRKNKQINIFDLESFISNLEVPNQVKQELYNCLNINKYIGYSNKL